MRQGQVRPGHTETLRFLMRKLHSLECQKQADNLLSITLNSPAHGRDWRWAIWANRMQYYFCSSCSKACGWAADQKEHVGHRWLGDPVSGCPVILMPDRKRMWRP